MAQPSASTCRQRQQKRHLGCLPAHRSSSQTVQGAQADQVSCYDDDRTQRRLGSWISSLLRRQQWRLPSGAGTAVLLSALVAAVVYMVADPALADTFHSRTATGPVVPGLSRTLLFALMDPDRCRRHLHTVQSCHACQTNAYGSSVHGNPLAGE